MGWIDLEEEQKTKELKFEQMKSANIFLKRYRDDLVMDIRFLEKLVALRASNRDTMNENHEKKLIDEKKERLQQIDSYIKLFGIVQQYMSTIPAYEGGITFFPSALLKTI